MTLGFVALLGACAPKRPEIDVAPAQPDKRPAADSVPAKSPLEGEALLDGGWQPFESASFRFRLMLPDRNGWREASDERWLTLLHPRSQSSLRFRTWVAGPRVSKDECLEQLYLWQGDLRPISDPVLTGSLAQPSGFDVGLRIDLSTQGSLASVAIAYGANVRRCYAAIAQTQAGPSESQEVVGGRLRLLVEGSLGSVVILGVEERAAERPAL